ncbi:hypothetical protein Srut_17170 [Streptomyces rutgersensis]|uniref:hypothetical protein n=1 Tax=Streptomyces rutgersensis TaxID=53451 RepID=UPI0013C98E35|nr:hypothetical protein [Streptomyces rutgersensis]GFH65203.1 hypothetical protein Srut_17170 [Streptomyces rutgersensis]
MTDRRPTASWLSVLLLALALGAGLVVAAHVVAPDGAQHVLAGADGVTSPVERRNQSFVTGGLLAVLPLSVLLSGTVVRRARYGRVIAAGSEEEPPALRPTRGEARAAAGVAVAVAGAALWTLGATGERTGAGREGVRELAPLWSGDFWPGVLLVGPVAALLLLLLVRVGTALLHVVRERLGHGVPLVLRYARDDAQPVFTAPAEPSRRWLTGALQRELRLALAEFESAALPAGAAREWVWSGLDAAVLAVGHPDEVGRGHRDRDPAALAAALILVRCVRAGLGICGARPGTRPPVRMAAACCALNPLHGPASLRERLRVPGGGPGTELPVCSLCSDYLRLPFVSPSPGLLLLPGPRHTRVPYLEAAGPLPAVHGGLNALVREIKETPVRTEPSRARDRRGPLLAASAALGLAAVVALAGQAGAGGSVNWLVPLPLFVGAAVGAVYVRRHPGERRAEPRTVFTTAEEAAFVRKRARTAELLPELGLLIAEAPVALPGGTPGMERALDAYAAAGTVLDGARDLADLAGVVALVEEGTAPIRAEMNAARPSRRRLLSRRSVPAQPHTPLTCFFNPFHGLATAGEVSWRMLGRRDLLTVAVCAECAAALAARRTPQSLTVRHEGRLVPYYEVPPEQSLWAATGYGSLTGGPLAPLVNRGDFRRAAEQR